MKNLSVLFLAILLSISSCYTGEVDELDYNLLYDTGEVLVEVISSQVLPVGNSKKVKFVIKNRYNELSDLQKETITDLVLTSYGIVVQTFPPDVTEFTTQKFDPFSTYCFKFSYGNSDGEITRETIEYCFDF
ncbi:MAG: hypothetical protein ACI8YQ_003365 [Polaribacter sp.]|jgi:hypothetical protein